MSPMRMPTTHPADHEDSRQQQCEDEYDGRHRADVTDAAYTETDGWRRHPRGSDEAGVDEPDEQDEQPDTGRDRGLQLDRHGIENQPAQAGRRQRDDDEPVDDDQPHRFWPGQRADQSRGDEGVETEPRGECERQPGNDAEQDGHDTRGQRCHGRDLFEFQLVAGDVLDAGQNDRVQHDDVCHRDERDYAAAKFVGDRGPSCRDLEEPIEAIHSSTLGVSTTRVISCSARRNTRRSSAESTESQRSSPR